MQFYYKVKYKLGLNISLSVYKATDPQEAMIMCKNEYTTIKEEFPFSTPVLEILDIERIN